MNWRPPDEIRVRKRITGAAIFFALAASLLAGFATVERACIFFAVPLYLFAILAWAVAPGGFTLRFHADCIEHRQSGVRVPYEAITFLRLSNRVVLDEKTAAKAPQMLIGHPRGCWRLPRHAPVSRLELYRFLLEKSCLLDPPAHFPGRLREVYEREVADFGAAQVLATGGREVNPGEVPQARTFLVVFLIFLAAAITAVAGSAGETISATFVTIASISLFLGIVLFPVLRSQRRTLRKLREACGLVISPRGLTLETPALKGALEWSELKGVVVMHRANALLSGLVLKIEGGQILLGDHFVCPLTEIRRRVETNLAFERR